MTEHQPVPNGLFDERPWQDIPVPSLATVNQQPARWVLQWYEIGEELEAPKAGAKRMRSCDYIAFAAFINGEQFTRGKRAWADFVSRHFKPLT